MEIKAFLIRFEKNLIASGFSPDTARHHTLKIAKGLDESDRARILAMTSEAQADSVAKSYVARLRRRAAVPETDTMANTSTISSNFSGSMHTGEVEKIKVYKTKAKPEPIETVKKDVSYPDEIEEAQDYSATRQFTQVKDASATEDGSETRQFFQVKVDTADSKEDNNVKTTKINVVKRREENKRSENDFGKTKNISKVTSFKKKLSPEGKKEYTKQILSRIPLFVLGFAGAGAGAFIVYALIALLIAAFIALLIGVVVAGGVGTLAGLIYGIIKLFSVMPEGVYEIGFALATCGVTMALSICSYNVAVRAVPVLWRQFTYFLTDCLNKFRTYIRRIRKECEDR